MKKIAETLSVAAAVLALAWVIARPAGSAPDASLAKYSVGSEKAGYVYLDPQLRAMESDPIENPGYLWVDKGKTLWNAAAGSTGQSCASCHGAAEQAMRGVGAAYPKIDPQSGKLVDLEQRINLERARMGAAPYAWESEQLLALTAYIKSMSRGMPVRVAVDGPAHQYWLEGKRYYETRRGQLDMSCEQCHGQYAGRQLRGDVLSQGQTNGFPEYRLKWQAVGSVQRRFRSCDTKIRAQTLPYGSPEYVALELYIASRGEGLPIETPAVRK
ncbi:sulfur oxidation c-type cytochrome SoxA [bacterium]|nr:MAG: sulfur oxidation c-type cytochrome SoxA [bacterium]